MKKVVRMLGLCALVALAFTSCKKNETNGNGTFKATISQIKTDGRTHLETINAWGWKALYWNTDDVIKLFDRSKSEDNSATYKVQDITEQVATFTGNAEFLANLDVDSAYIAFYPNAQETAEGIVMEVPTVQNWANASFEDDKYPMFGFNDVNGNFQFHSDAGVLYLNFKLNPSQYFVVDQPDAEVTVPLTSIVVRGKNTDDVLSGKMRYQLDGSYEMFDTQNYVQLNCSGINLSNKSRMEFIIILPEGALANGFYVDINTSTGTKTLEGNGTILEETMLWMGQLDLEAGL